MPLEDYDGETFVAFVDISGFREMMRDRAKAALALDKFYQAGYDILKDQPAIPKVDGLFVSDCGIHFVRSNDSASADGLNAMLRVVEALNRRLLDASVMLTTSVAYGPFTYEQRLEFRGIEKNPMFGNAYLDAYLDNEGGRPKIQPGQCRVVCRGLPNQLDATGGDPRLAVKCGDHRYFYWMVAAPTEIEAFNRRYADTQSLKYRAMLDVLRAAVANDLDGRRLASHTPDGVGEL